MNSATLPLLAIAARLAAERRINAKDRLPHSTKKIARVGASPDRPHLRCVTRKPVGPQYGITLLVAEGPDGVHQGVGVGVPVPGRPIRRPHASRRPPDRTPRWGRRRLPKGLIRSSTAPPSVWERARGGRPARQGARE